MKKILLSFLLLTFCFTTPAFAEEPFKGVTDGLKKTGTAAKFDTSVSETTLAGTIGNIVQIILSLLGIIFMILMIYGGFVWLIAAGDESKVTTAKNVIRNSIIGLAIVLAAYAISNFVFAALESSITPGQSQPATSGGATGGTGTGGTTP